MVTVNRQIVRIRAPSRQISVSVPAFGIHMLRFSVCFKELEELSRLSTADADFAAGDQSRVYHPTSTVVFGRVDDGRKAGHRNAGGSAFGRLRSGRPIQ